jgi:hypothetical protein
MMSVEAFEAALRPQVEDLPVTVRDRIVGLYAAHAGSTGAQLGPALFFWMPEYVRVGLRLNTPTTPETGGGEEPLPVFGTPGTQAPSGGEGAASDAGGTADEDAVASLVAEAYLAAAGTWLARLDEAELDALGAQVTASAVAALPSPQWEWLRRLLPALG